MNLLPRNVFAPDLYTDVTRDRDVAIPSKFIVRSLTSFKSVFGLFRSICRDEEWWNKGWDAKIERWIR